MTRPDILCIGATLWDIIGRAPAPIPPGGDVPGQILRLPGGVAFNIAAALRRCGMRPALLSAIGRDAEGDALVAECEARGLILTHALRTADLPTDRYMAIEAGGALVAAVADAHSLERAGKRILAPMLDGRLGEEAAPWSGLIALDGNLTPDLLAEIAASALFGRADLRLAPASPGKADRLAPFLNRAATTLYLNRAEAEVLTGAPCPDAATAAQELIARGACRVLVTDGDGPAADATPDALVTGQPPRVTALRVTGAGDTFMAAHIAAESRGADRTTALQTALHAAATFVSGVPGS